MKKLKTPGLHGDGGGLHLRVTKTGTKSWIFRYSRRDMGLGAYPTVTLEAARDLAAAARKLRTSAVDPIEARRVEPSAQPQNVTFAEACRQYLAAHEAGWKNAKHRQQRRNTLSARAEPIIGAMNVMEITANDCLRVLSPIWTEKPETASRLRGRMEAVLDWCVAKGFRDRGTVNPASWRGNLKHLLSERRKDRHASPRNAVAGDSCLHRQTKRAREALAARALELTILTATRTSEALLAERGEIAGDVWAIPATRMKSGRPHSVPLVPRAVEIIAALLVIEGSQYLFPGQRQGRPLSI